VTIIVATISGNLRRVFWYTGTNVTG